MTTTIDLEQFKNIAAGTVAVGGGVHLLHTLQMNLAEAMDEETRAVLLCKIQIVEEWMDKRHTERGESL